MRLGYITDAEQALLERCGYEVSQNVHGDPMCRPEYRSGFNSSRYELDFVNKIGEECARALVAMSHLRGRVYSVGLRHFWERTGKYDEMPENPW